MHLINFRFLLILTTLLISQNSFSQFGNRTIIDSTSRGCTDIISFDYDKDDYQDLVLSQKYNTFNRIIVYPGVSNGGFSPYLVVDSLVFPDNIGLMDASGDDFPDIIACSKAEQKIYIYHNDNGAFNKEIVDSTQIDVHKIQLLSDYRFFGFSSDSLILHYKSPFGWVHTAINTHPIQNLTSSTLLDYNNDGDKDLILGGDNILIIDYDATTGTWNMSSVLNGILPNSSQVITSLNSIDINSDGKQDILFSRAGKLKWIKNLGNSNFELQTTCLDSGLTQVSDLDIAEVNNDGNIDFALVDIGTGKTISYLNNGDNTFTKSTVFTDLLPKTRQLCFTPSTQDGAPNLVWADNLSMHSNALINIEEIKSTRQYLFEKNPGVFLLPETNFMRFELYSLDGKKLKPLINNSEIDLTNLPKGYYILKSDQPSSKSYWINYF